MMSVDDVIYAIREMVVRGAPLIGVTAAYGVYLAAVRSAEKPDPVAELKAECERIKAARPTAINLAWAADRMLAEVLK